MSARILYVETRMFDPYHDKTSQFVRVELRQWKDGSHHDTIIEEMVVVDGEEVVNSTRVLGGYSDADHIRHAIRTFDELVAAHPWANGEPDHAQDRADDAFGADLDVHADGSVDR